jgi:hypothetical protein
MAGTCRHQEQERPLFAVSQLNGAVYLDLEGMLRLLSGENVNVGGHARAQDRAGDRVGVVEGEVVDANTMTGNPLRLLRDVRCEQEGDAGGERVAR